jgi:hypothetical protein
VTGFKQGPVARHGCPSHGIGLTPDEREIWLYDAHNRRLHVFDNTVMPPKQKESIARISHQRAQGRRKPLCEAGLRLTMPGHSGREH